MLSIWVLYLQLSLLLTGDRPVSYNDPASGHVGHDWLTRLTRSDLTSRPLQLLQKLSSILRTVRSSFWAPARVHCGQLTVQNKAEPAITTVGQLEGCSITPEIQTVSASHHAPVFPVIWSTLNNFCSIFQVTGSLILILMKQRDYSK